MARIYVLHENAPWVEPLEQAFAAQDLPYELWFLEEGILPFDDVPPPGVFYNRMSASSHTRGHRFAPELTAGVLAWLESHQRRVVNDSRALALEVSKLAQYAALQRAGIAVPRTLAAVGRDRVMDAVEAFGDGPYILKPNRGGKGLGVRLFQNKTDVATYLHGPAAAQDAPIDGIWLVQDYIRAPEPFITRLEFVGGKFLYALRVDTRDGFELCPADACAIGTAACPAESAADNKFSILGDFAADSANAHLIARCEGFLRANGIEIAGIEIIRNIEGKVFTYDVNTNTNYNMLAEKAAGLPHGGMWAIAQFLGTEFNRLRFRPDGIAAAE
ncbi:MAG TPA: alpha-L-glutamate ligase [Kiloniellaceae bacterium]|nr:alpha-L-glutamate ligase [Kiloniellaceae bacterium]